MAARECQYSESLGASTNTTTSYTTKTSVTWTPQANTDYLILWSAVVHNDTNLIADVFARLFDGTTPLCEFNIESKDTTDIGQLVGGIGRWQEGASPASRTISVQWRAETSGNTCTMEEARLVILALTSDDFYAQAGGTTTTSASYVDAATFNFTPATSGDYLILSSCRHANTSDGDSYGVRALDPSSTAFSTMDGRTPKDSTNTHAWVAMT
jgi:hypothetical protein